MKASNKAHIAVNQTSHRQIGPVLLHYICLPFYLFISLLLFAPTAGAEATSAAPPPPYLQDFVQALAVVKRNYIEKTDDHQLVTSAMRGMLSSLDPHSALLDKEAIQSLGAAISGQFVGIGIELTTEQGLLKVISPIEGTPADRAGIKAHDLIIKIDERLVRRMTLNQAMRQIRGPKGTQVTLTILRTGEKKPIQFVVTRDLIRLVAVKSQMLEPGFGYIRISFFQHSVYPALKKKLSALKKEAQGKLKGLVLDLRNNPGGLLKVSAEVAGAFLDPEALKQYNGLIVYTKGRIPSAQMQWRATSYDSIPGVPLIVLINGGSASAAEIVAGALQDYKRAVIIGTQSFGKGSVQTILRINKDISVKLTTALYYTPAGRMIQAAGILPDVLIPELKVDTPADTRDSLAVNERAHPHYLLGDHSSEATDAESAAATRRAKTVALAKKDYLLYEALVFLKGMSVLQR